MYHLRASDFVDWASCRRKFMYRSVRGWEVPSLGWKADMGTVIHAGIAHWYRTGQLGAIATDGAVLSSEDATKCEDVVRYFIEQTTPNRSNVLSVEEDTELLIPELDLVIHTHFDVAKMEASGPVIEDHKTKEDIPAEYGWFDLDWQMKIYQVTGWKKYGGPCTVQHNLIRREVPPGFGHRPEYNEMVSSTGKVYNKKSTASTDPRKYIRQIRFEKSEETLAHYYQEIVSSAREIIQAKTLGEGTYYNRQSNFLCGGCPYLVPCIREQDGESIPLSLTEQLYMKAK